MIVIVFFLALVWLGLYRIARNPIVMMVVIIMALHWALAGHARASDGPLLVSPITYCATAGDDDKTKPLPQSLYADARRLFGQGLTDETIRAGVVWRCMDGRVFVCSIGANLPCWKADASRISKGGDEFCEENHSAASIPAAATGHGTIYNWACDGRKAIIVSQPFTLDRRGFIVELWKKL